MHKLEYISWNNNITTSHHIRQICGYWLQNNNDLSVLSFIIVTALWRNENQKKNIYK